MVLFFSADNATLGITFGGGYYWLPGLGGTIYAYNTDGTHSSENDIDLDSDNNSSQGITYHDDKLWVVDRVDYKVYAYNTDGSRASTDDF